MPKRLISIKGIATVAVIAMLIGCKCDSVCQAHKEAKTVVQDSSSNKEILDFLLTYKGEAPNAEMYNVFVNWGVSNPNRFISIINEPKLTKKELDVIIYKISDMGQSNKYCLIFKSSSDTANEKYIQKSLLGCPITSQD